MTLNDLKRIIPEEHHDKLIEIYLPHKEDGDYLPLIDVVVNEHGRNTTIQLEADWE